MSHTSSNDPYWREAMAPYARPVLRRSIVDILTSVVPFLVLWGVMYMALDVSYWLVLLISLPTAGFLLRTFILFHDCTHGSFFASRRANLWGGRIFGLLTFQCFTNWRHHHAIHHGAAGDLDRRGSGRLPDRQGHFRRPGFHGQAQFQHGRASPVRENRRHGLERDRQRLAGNPEQRLWFALPLYLDGSRPQLRQ